MSAHVSASGAGEAERLFIGGGWTSALDGATFENTSPIDAAGPPSVVASAGRQDVEAAVAAAVAAAPGWRGTPPAVRTRRLHAVADAIDGRHETITECIVGEVGKPVREASAEVTRAAEVFRFHAGQAMSESGALYRQAAGAGVVAVERRPVGVAALITPWNFPLAIPAWKTAPALAYGNTVILKVASQAPSTGMHLARCLDDAELPPGVVNVLAGPGAVVGQALASHPLVRVLSFTGSTQAGRQLRTVASEAGKRIQLEMGGHNPLVVLRDAQISAAVEAAFVGAFSYAGQKCTATRRIFVQDEVYGAFREQLVARIERAGLGDPRDDECEIGPLIDERAVAAALEAIGRAETEGARVLSGGYRVDGELPILAPTLLEHVSDRNYFSCNEVFAPVVSINPVQTLDAAIARCNATEYGLTAGLFTSDAKAIRRFEERIETGMMRVNSATVGADVHVPFGGVKASGYGPREQGSAARELFTSSVTIYRSS